MKYPAHGGGEAAGREGTTERRTNYYSLTRRSQRELDARNK